MAAGIYGTSGPRPRPGGSRTDGCHFPREVVHISCISPNLGTCSVWTWRMSRSSVECKVVGLGQMECSHMTSLPVCFQGDGRPKLFILFKTCM